MDRVLKAARASGSLNLSSRFLKAVPDEVYQSLDAVGNDEKWWEAVDLQKLIIAHNNIEELKEDLRNLPQLTVLNVAHNKLPIFPLPLESVLPMLKSLDVSFNSLLIVSEEIGSATSLVMFNCSNNQLKELPSSLGNCINLSELKASNNSLVGLPEDIANCSKLMKQDIEGNKLTVLSENILASLSLLMEFNAAKNLLTSIQESKGNLPRLIRALTFTKTIFAFVWSMFSYLTKLWKYGADSALAFSNFRNNVLSSLPVELGTLSALGTLDLHSNQVDNGFICLSAKNFSELLWLSIPAQKETKNMSIFAYHCSVVVVYLLHRMFSFQDNDELIPC
ncbi:hypothetical protein RJ641_034429 [Dillenia turbinata]|uniref:Uncharacterized protein n=1 Tax=Dillenia turbinata TaxID=194707 RepID=A0AAN8ZBK1_9MAGN